MRLIINGYFWLMERKFLIWGFIFGISAILLGAFGAHALKEILSEQQLDSFETGVKYQMYHALLLIILSQIKHFQTKWILSMTVIGVFLFSFSIYFLNLKTYLGMEFLSFLGPITPLGGLLLITTWVCLLVKAVNVRTT